MPASCLYVAKQLDGAPLPFPSHVQPVFIRYPEPALRHNGARVGRLSTWLRVAGRLAGNAWFAGRVGLLARQFQPDIIHVHTPLPLAAGIVAKLVTRCPLVLTFHGTDYQQFSQSRFLQSLVRRYVDHVTCVAADMVEDIRKRWPELPVTDIGNGVDIELFRPAATREAKKQIVTVGRLVWQKGYDVLLRSMVPVFQRFPEYRLLFVGQGPLEEDLRNLARELGIADRVSFAGVLTQLEIVTALNESALFVMSSVSEGFPKALIEAMACGLPVVATRVGACSSVVADAGLIVDPGDSTALATAVTSILSDQPTRDAYAEQAIRTAAQYTWQHQTTKVEALYQRLTGTH